QPEQDRERMAMMEADLLERVVPDLAHHEPRHREDDEQHRDVLAGLALAAEPEPEEHGGGDHAGRRRDGEADEVPLLDRSDLHVEAGEPERAAGHVERGGEPAPASPRPQRPLIDEDAGRDAEGDQVGERVVLDAEGAGRAREPRDAPVERVAELRHQDHHRREPVLPRRPAAGGVERADDRVEAREEPGRGEQVGQQVDALAQRRDAPAAAEAARNLPAVWRTGATVAETGLRFTCTSSGDMKMLTRVAGAWSTRSSRSSITATTRPSAGETTSRSSGGARRSGSRKK